MGASCSQGGSKPTVRILVSSYHGSVPVEDKYGVSEPAALTGGSKAPKKGTAAISGGDQAVYTDVPPVSAAAVAMQPTPSQASPQKKFTEIDVADGMEELLASYEKKRTPLKPIPMVKANPDHAVSRVAVRGNSSTSLSPSDKITLDDDRPQPNRSPPRVQKGHSYATKQSMPFLEKADEDD